jgi:hypothetical protein
MNTYGVTTVWRRSEAPAHTGVAGEWERGYREGLLLVDGSVALISAVLAYVTRPGVDRAVWSDGVYAVATATGPMVWVGVLALAGGYELRHFGDGPGDGRHVLEAGALVLGVVGLLTWGQWDARAHHVAVRGTGCPHCARPEGRPLLDGRVRWSV